LSPDSTGMQGKDDQVSITLKVRSKFCDANTVTKTAFSIIVTPYSMMNVFGVPETSFQRWA